MFLQASWCKMYCIHLQWICNVYIFLFSCLYVYMYLLNYYFFIFNNRPDSQTDVYPMLIYQHSTNFNEILFASFCIILLLNIQMTIDTVLQLHSQKMTYEKYGAAGGRHTHYCLFDLESWIKVLSIVQWYNEISPTTVGLKSAQCLSGLTDS